MLALTHSLTGAVAGGLIGNPFLSFGTGVGLHFLFDKIPHFWPKKDSQMLLLLGVDWLVTTIFVIWLFLNIKIFGSGPFWGAFGGFLVDLILVTIGVAKKNPISNWHSKRQPHKTNPKFIFTDVSAIILAILTSLVVL